jgi:hypothetical protein
MWCDAVGEQSDRAEAGEPSETTTPAPCGSPGAPGKVGRCIPVAPSPLTGGMTMIANFVEFQGIVTDRAHP